MRKIRILIVDDSTVVRRLLSDVLASDPVVEVAGTAANGRLALAKIPRLNPDVVTLDIEMPDLDGLATLRELRKIHPRLPVIMFSTLTERGAVATLDALALGANDYVTKPANVGSVIAGMQAVRDSLIPKIKGLCSWFAAAPAPTPTVAAVRRDSRSSFSTKISRRRVEIVVIGTSTGGPNALGEVLSQFPADFPVPVVVVQHMPPVFTRHLAARLDQSCRLHVQEGRPLESLESGDVWIAPGDYHLTAVRQAGKTFLKTNQESPENSCRPAVDVLFRSVAEAYGPSALAVVMTGMGCDGLRGCEAIRTAGGRVIVQDEASSVVWGMPGAVASAGLADRVLALPRLAAQIVADVEESRTRTLARMS